MSSPPPGKLIFFAILLAAGTAVRAAGQDGSEARKHVEPTDTTEEVTSRFSKADSMRSEPGAIDVPGSASTPPYTFVSSGTATLMPNRRYEAGGFARWLLGREYRELWTMPFQVPIIDLDRSAGGLTPLERGGGMQTTSLHLEGADGHFYVLRSVDKTAERTVPEGFRGTFVESIAQDQISSLNPVGSLILPPLARAAGILHTHPTLVVIPDSPRLGEFRDEYAGMLAQFERKPDEDQSEAERFGFSENIVGTEKMFEESLEDNDERVDERAYARARLFDMLIGDWDRHEEQWRWAEFESEHGIRFVAVPKDRDFAFVKFDGFVNRIGRLSGNMMYRRLVDFDDEISDVLGLNWQGAKLDRRLTPSLTRSDWVEIADSLRRALTDDVIDEAVRTWPPTVYERIGERTAAALKARRDRLPDTASRYYDLLAETVDVVGSDKHERFEITRRSRDETDLVVYKTKKEGDVVRELMRRTFRHDETDELRLYGLGGNDFFLVDGRADDGLLIRIIGGEGADSLIDRSQVAGFKRLTRFYDTPEETTVERGPETRVYVSADPRVNAYEGNRFELHTAAPVASIDYNSDDGVFVGGGIRLVRSGFRKDPYAARHLITLEIAPRSRAYHARYDGRLVSVWNGFDASLQADALDARAFRHFYGLGNETPESARWLYRAELRNITAAPALRRGIGGHSYVAFGPRAEFVRVSPGGEAGPPGTPEAGSGFTAEDLGDHYLAGFRSTVALDGRDSTLNPQNGFYWEATTAFNAGLRDSPYRFGRLSSELRLFYTPPLPGQLTLALRAGGSTNVGRFPFFAAGTLGGSENLRGYRRTRFAGRSAAFANAELRAKLLDFNIYVLKGELGVIGFVDQGRVWVDDETSDVWHRGYGGGLWMTPFRMTVVTATLGYSEEGALLDLSAGFQF